MERDDESVVLVDHKVHAAEAADLDELVGRYVSQLWWYQLAPSVASLESSPVMCVAFPVQGVICEVEIGEASDVSRRRAIDMTRY